MLNVFQKIVALIACLYTYPVFSHTGVHNELYHPLSGVDHFLTILIVALVSGIAVYYYKK